MRTGSCASVLRVAVEGTDSLAEPRAQDRRCVSHVSSGGADRRFSGVVGRGGSRIGGCTCGAGPFLNRNHRGEPRRIGQILARLDNDKYEVRRQAAEQLEQLLGRPELKATLAAEIQRAMRDPQVSFEVRTRLERLARRLPAPAAQPAEHVTTPELDRVIAQLDDDSFGVRLAAAQRLEWLVSNPQTICPALVRLKQRLADPATTAETSRHLEPAWRQVRAAWLLSDPRDWSLPPVGDEQIKTWIDDLAQPAPESMPGGWSVHVNARRELMDLLGRDEYVPRVKAASGQAALGGRRTRRAVGRSYRSPGRRAAGGDSDADAAGDRGRVLAGPSAPGRATPDRGPAEPGRKRAVRPSYFDRVDDRVAHCVSGQSLAPGDYPVGIAFPHPTEDKAFFHIVNLPTPRRQMAYAYYAHLDEARRLTEISRRTLDRYLAEKRALADREIELLDELDYGEVSRFAGRYFNLVDDDPVLIFSTDRTENPGSRHAAICVLLATSGTKATVPGLLEALNKRRFLEPTTTPPCRWAWLAALAIAARDPWPNVDAWLAEQIDRTDALVDAQAESPELGATAAGILVSRHHHAAVQFGLTSASLPGDQAYPFEPYRFEVPADRERIKRWWSEEGQREKTAWLPLESVAR